MFFGAGQFRSAVVRQRLVPHNIQYFSLLSRRKSFHRSRNSGLWPGAISQVMASNGNGHAPSHGVKCVEDSIIVSDADTRKYRGLVLENGMTVLAIQDEKATKAAASLNVGVGGYQDPEGLPGLAHFCEHMLFLGTEKFPEENDYHQFIDDHGGSPNAVTRERSTKYFFDVSVDHLRPALDRFSQFFIAPLFNANCTEREVNAVDSEFEQNLHQDGWRAAHVFAETCDPAHPHAKFYCGNKATLWTEPQAKGVDVREALLSYHSKYYSSNIMTLAILGKESLDELTQMAVDLFLPIRNLNISLPPPEGLPFRSEDLKVEIHMVPIKDKRHLSLQFPMRDMRHHYKSVPMYYVGHLIGHEARGSLLSLLKKEGYCTVLEAGGAFTPGGWDMFEVHVDLTETGLEHVEDIIHYVFQYIALMKSKKPEEWIFRELSDIAAMSFRFQNQCEPIHQVTDAVDRMQDYPLVDVLSIEGNFDEFRPDLIEEVLSFLTPENSRIEVVAKAFEGKTDRKEKWFGGDYSVAPISDERIKSWSSVGLHPELDIPPRNDFVPRHFDLKAKDSEPPSFPVLIKNSDHVAVWFKPDTLFNLPKCCVALQIQTPKIFESELSYCYSVFFSRLFHDAMAEFSYMATRCEINFQTSSEPRAFQLFVTGYDDKLRTFLERVFLELMTFEPSNERFTVFKEQIVRDIQNYSAEIPYQHASDVIKHLTEHRSYRLPQLLAHAQASTPEGLKQFISEIFSTCQLVLMTVGNATKEETISLSEWIETKLIEHRQAKPLSTEGLWNHQQLKLPDGCNYLHKMVNGVHTSACVNIYLQVGEQNVQNNVLLLLVHQLMEEKFFDALRTKRQLGYIVGCSVKRSSGIQGYSLVVQSEKNPEHVELCMEAFLQDFEEKLDNLTDELFDVAVEGLVVRLSQRPKNIYGELAQYWSEVTSNRYCFDIREQCTKHAKTVKKEEVVKFYKEFITPSAPRRRKCCVHVVPKEDVSMGEVGDVPDGPSMSKVEIVSDIEEFRTKMPLYDSMKPYVTLPKPGAALPCSE